MPVVDHTIHPGTQKAGTEPYGCCNRKMKRSYAVKVRRYKEGQPYYLMANEYVKHRMSTECRHDNSLNDPGCATCKHRGSGEKYSAMVREKAV